MGMRFAVLAAAGLVLGAGLPLTGQTDCNGAGAGPLRTVASEWDQFRDVLAKAVANDAAFKAARIHYAYDQDFMVQTLGQTGDGQFRPNGELHQTAEVHFDEHGRRIEHVTYSPQNTLRRLTLEPEDLTDIFEVSAFPIPADRLSEYTVVFAGRQRVDELETYVFDITPKTIDKRKRYFQGRIWVDADDKVIVKSCGKSVPDVVSTGKRDLLGRPKRVIESLHPTYVTYRQQVDGKYWFPAYTRSDDVLQFRNGDLRLHEILKCRNYRAAGGLSEAGKKEQTSPPQ